MAERFFDVGDTRVFADVRGDPGNPPLLCIHGGPGMGCWDFMRAQGDRLATHFYLIGLDQRGVLRSDRLPPHERPSVAQLVRDFESVRAQLGLPSWAILGHSAGGAYTVDYAATHPDTVSAAVFDCPALDLDRTERHRLPRLAEMHEAHGNAEMARRCREVAASPERISADNRFRALSEGLGDRIDEFNFRDEKARREFRRARDESGFGARDWGSGASHAPILAELYRDSRIPTLDRIAVPSMLLHGRFDPVTSPDQIAEYRDRVGGPVTTLHGSAHFPQLEEPEAYAAVVTGFLATVSENAP